MSSLLREHVVKFIHHVWGSKEYFPGPQGSHSVLRTSEDFVFVRQSIHPRTAAVEYLPAAQFVQWLKPIAGPVNPPPPEAS